MNSELLLRLVEERKTTTALLFEIDEESICKAFVHGAWTVKDILGHLSAWEAEVVRGLASLRSGGRAKYWGAAISEYEKLNKKWYRENRDRELDRITTDFSGCRKQILRQLKHFGESELYGEKKWPGVPHRTLAKAIDEIVLNHESGHRSNIELWWHERQRTDR